MTTRERLKDAMADLLWERGYAATSPRDVMERAGAGQGSMYHHFSGKHALAVEALGEVMTELTGKTSSLVGDGSPLERIRTYMAAPRLATRGCRAGRMTQDPAVVEDPELLALVAGAFDAMLARWEAAIAEAVRLGELPADAVPADLARTLSAVIQGGYVLSRAKASPAPMDAAVRGALGLLDAAHRLAQAG